MDENAKPGLERRKHLRVPVDLSVSYSVKPPAQVQIKIDGQQRDATMVNVSEGGMALVIDCALPEMTKLDIRFQLHPKRGRPVVVTCVGQVCYNFLLADYHRYHTGIEFIMIRDEEKRLVADFVKSSLR